MSTKDDHNVDISLMDVFEPSHYYIVVNNTFLNSSPELLRVNVMEFRKSIRHTTAFD